MKPDTLKEKTAKGLLWGGFSNGMQQVLNLLFGICLARILTPADYGMVGMLTIFSLIAGLLQESGFTAALANKKTIRHEDYNAVFWFSFLTGLLMYVILFFAAPLIADFYHQPALTSLSRCVFLGFLISSTGTAHNAYLFRNMKVKENALISMWSLVISGITGVTMAFCGMAYWGLAMQGLVFVSCNTAGKWLFSGWRPTFEINLKPLKGMIGFSCKILGANIVTIINNNILTVLLGRFYTNKDVGLYNQANKWNMMGYSTIQGMINGIAQPTFHNVEDDRNRQVRVFRKMLRFTSFITFPCMFGLALTAPELITIAVTDKWAESAVMMQVICIGGAFIPIQYLYQNLIISRGKSDLNLCNSILYGIIQIITAVICCQFSIQIMIAANVLINILWILVWHYWAWKEIRIPLLAVLKDITSFAGIAVAVMISTYFITREIGNVYGLFISKIVVAAVLYITIMKLAGIAIFKECVRFIYEHFPKKKEL